jgi:hypothetical protein
MLYLQRNILWHPLDRRMGRYLKWAEYGSEDKVSVLLITVTELSQPYHI